MKVLTANRLSDGEAVWLTADLTWAENFQDAHAVAEADGLAQLEAAGKKGLVDNEVVDVNLIDVDLVDGSLRPLRLREQIRANGPSTHFQFGKQARFAPNADPAAT